MKLFGFRPPAEKSFLVFFSGCSCFSRKRSTAGRLLRTRLLPANRPLTLEGEVSGFNNIMAMGQKFLSGLLMILMLFMLVFMVLNRFFCNRLTPKTPLVKRKIQKNTVVCGGKKLLLHFLAIYRSMLGAF